MLPMKLRCLVGIALAAVVVPLAGCGGGPQTAEVKGKVTYKGKAVPNGTITFLPESGPTATGELKPDGTYTLTTFRDGDGAIPGNYTVIIMAMQDTTSVLPESRSALPPPIVPIKYTHQTTTDLRAEVKPGKNTFDFDLVDEKNK
jgi:hypothetical protein